MRSTTIGLDRIRTWALMGAMLGLFVLVGGLVGGPAGMTLALVMGLAINFALFWWSDTLALRANGARPLAEGEAPEVRSAIARLAERAGIPAPRVYIVDRDEPNAFATGRSPSHSAVAVTRGLLETLDRRQLEGVLAHELMHIRNRDTLVGTIAAAVGGAVSWLAQMAMFSAWMGGDEEEGGNPLALVGAMILAPIAAMIIQLAVSRGREFMADASGAALTGDPEGLAQALERIGERARGDDQRSRVDGDASDAGGAQRGMNPAFNHLYFTSGLAGARMAGLFSTHPAVADRVARLRADRGGRSAVVARQEPAAR
jgi:heat shock protein HtpX